MKAIQRLQEMIEYGFKELNEDETVKMRMDADALMLEIEQADETIDRQAEQIDRLEKALKFADYLIGKLAGWNGIDLSTLDEEYPEYKTIKQALAAQPQKGE